MKRSAPEFHLTTATATFLRYAMPADLPWSHFPSGEKRDSRTAAKLKHMGLNAGWPDFVFVLPLGRVAFIELKAGKGRLSEAQERFRDSAERLGARWAECRSVDEVEAQLIRWFSPFGIHLKARTA